MKNIVLLTTLFFALRTCTHSLHASQKSSMPTFPQEVTVDCFLIDQGIQAIMRAPHVEINNANRYNTWYNFTHTLGTKKCVVGVSHMAGFFDITFSDSTTHAPECVKDAFRKSFPPEKETTVTQIDNGRTCKADSKDFSAHMQVYFERNAIEKIQAACAKITELLPDENKKLKPNPWANATFIQHLAAYAKTFEERETFAAESDRKTQDK